MEKEIDELVVKLASTVTGDNLFNPYNQIDTRLDTSTAPGLRQNNLRSYLYTYCKVHPKEIWVTEYIDYTTTRFSGIPMILPKHFVKIKELLKITGYLEDTSKNKTVRVEDTKPLAIWKEIGKVKTLPLLWSVLPFFPHQKDNEQAKRNVQDMEYIKHAVYIKRLLDIYNIKRVVALNEKTKYVLSLLHIDSSYNSWTRL